LAFPDPFYRSRPHPWRGLQVGNDPPRHVQCYVEITPYDLVKYEVDKITGYMRVDRPQRTSSQPPLLYGFVLRTYCGRQVADLSPMAKTGDKDPLDMCEISERPINRAEVILNAKVIGGIQMVDREETDDKIIAVLENDEFWGDSDRLEDLPDALVKRLRHYFGTYKLVPGEEHNVSIESVYSLDHALEVVEAAMADYAVEYED
jgi:inorganic pyrophosphatase